jgi:hypothetical protein
LQVRAKGLFDDEAVESVPGVADVAEVQRGDAEYVWGEGEVEDAVVFLGTAFEGFDVVV